MVIYADSSYLVSLYADEQNSDTARSFIAKSAHPICLTDFSRSETQHALRLMAFRKLIAPDELIQCLLLFDEDQGSGIYRPLAIGNEQLFQKTSALSNRHALALGVRFLDVVHVAAASLAKADLFLTCDTRQAKLARAVGLHVKP